MRHSCHEGRTELSRTPRALADLRTAGRSDQGFVERQMSRRRQMPAENRDGPRRGTSGAVDAPDSGGRSWCAGTLNPEGECAYPNDEPFGGPNANGAQTTQVARPARRWHPANGVPSDRETCELPSV